MKTIYDNDRLLDTSCRQEPPEPAFTMLRNVAGVRPNEDLEQSLSDRLRVAIYCYLTNRMVCGCVNDGDVRIMMPHPDVAGPHSGAL